MDIPTVMQQLNTRLDTVDGLRVTPSPGTRIAPPTAILMLPDRIDYDQTYGRGEDKLSIPLAVIVGRANDRTASRAIVAYMNGSGASSVKAALESGTYTAFDEVVVTDAETETLTVGETDYLAVVFHLDIVGSGT